jgi:hypothetical protein
VDHDDTAIAEGLGMMPNTVAKNVSRMRPALSAAPGA